LPRPLSRFRWRTTPGTRRLKGQLPGPESSIEEWCGQLGALVGIEPKFEETDDTIAGVPVVTARLDGLAGGERLVSLDDGLRRMVAARRPDLLQQS